MDIGLYRDLAVGADPSGAETWANQRAVVDAVETGAPPDIYNPAGQSWGLPPFNPHTLYEEAYRSFIDLVRANMRHAGGLRIDHVMALQHLYWIPKGMSPAEGAYVSYPLSDLSGILALESHRNHCVVIDGCALAHNNTHILIKTKLSLLQFSKGRKTIGRDGPTSPAVVEAQNKAAGKVIAVSRAENASASAMQF